MSDTTVETPEQPMLDLQRINFLFGIPESKDAVFHDYVQCVANDGLLPYKSKIQHGKKAGEPLYNHVLNGIFVLEQLRPLLNLSDEETKILFTAFTIHDINKVTEGQLAYERLATSYRKLRGSNLTSSSPDMMTISKIF